MIQSSDQAQSYLQSHHSVLGKGWHEVESFDDVDDIDEYETEEEVEYITLDLGAAVDPRLLQTELTYQLVGMDTALPFLKIGNTLLHGEVTPLIGDEVIFNLTRPTDNPHNPSHPPLCTSRKRLTFRSITLDPIYDSTNEQTHSTTDQKSKPPQTGVGDDAGQAGSSTSKTDVGRSMFLQGTPRVGPNVGVIRIRDDTAAPIDSAAEPPILTGLHMTASGKRPRKPRPEIVIRTVAELASVDLDSLDRNVKIFMYPSVITDFMPGTTTIGKSSKSQSTSENTAEEIALEYTKPQLTKILTGRRARPRQKEKDTTAEPDSSIPAVAGDGLGAGEIRIGGVIMRTKKVAEQKGTGTAGSPDTEEPDVEMLETPEADRGT